MLTFVILAGFAVLVGVVTTSSLRGNFNDEVRSTVGQLARQLQGRHGLRWIAPGVPDCNKTVHLSDYASAAHAQIRIYDSTRNLLCTQDQVRIKGAKPPVASPSFPPPGGTGTFQQLGYRVVVRELQIRPAGEAMLLYARPLSDLDHTLAKVSLFLFLGVLGGTVLALLAGLANAQRAMRPITHLTEAAREIERTRDASRHVPLPRADDEVAELARTLEGMLQSLDQARTATEEMLARQREFVADASHELRTPLTSVLANLELLAEELRGEQEETATAALRSAKRMRRLVGDLLLLARADAKRVQQHRAMDLGQVLTEAVAELGPMAEDHEVTIDASDAVVSGDRDDLHRLILNLLENAVLHTPPGTHVRAATGMENGEAVLTVDDDGPGVPPELERRVFERFVRSGRDGGAGSGLGLAIVQAVARAHGGSVALERREGTGTRFVIRIPTTEDQTSTTTGSTIGRRRRRS